MLLMLSMVEASLEVLLLIDLLLFCTRKWNKSRFLLKLQVFFLNLIAKKIKYIYMQHIDAVLLRVTSMLFSCFKSIANYESNVGIKTGGMEIKNKWPFTSFTNSTCIISNKMKYRCCLKCIFVHFLFTDNSKSR